MNAYVTLTQWPAVVSPNGQQVLPAPAAVDVFGLDVIDFQVHFITLGTGATNFSIEGSMQNQLDDSNLWTALMTSPTAPSLGMQPVHIPGTVAGGTGFGPFRYLRWRLLGTISSGTYTFFIRGIGRTV